MTLDLSLVIPAYNESSRLAAGFDRLAPTLELLDPERYEVIIVDDGSSDATLHRAHDVYGHLAHPRFVQQPANFGKGAALRVGLGLARGTCVVTLDADMAIDPRHVPDVVAALATHDVVAGSRDVNGRIRYDSMLRTVAGAAFNRLVRHFSATTLRDTQCGCKGFTTGAARLLALLSMVDGFAFDVEVLYLADQLGLAVTALPVTWRDVAGSSVRPLHVARTMLRDIRSLAVTNYVNPVVQLPAATSPEDVQPHARAARLSGLVLAINRENALLVLGRDDALGALTLARDLGGTLRTAGPAELRGRDLRAI